MKFGSRVRTFGIIMLPLLILGGFSYWYARKQLISQIYLQRTALASLSAEVLDGKLFHLQDLGRSFASRPVFRQFVDKENWEAAIQMMENVPGDFPYIDNLLLADTNGIIRAEVPALPGIRNSDQAGFDWYQGVRKNRKPYISEVYRGPGFYQPHIISIAIPVSDRAGRIRAVLVMQVRVSQLLAWVNAVNVGNTGFIYIVDQKGHIAANRDLANSDSIIDYSTVPAVQKALKGGASIEILFNPLANESRLTAYKKLPSFGWAVVVQEEAATALFLNGSLLPILIFYGFIILLGVLLTSLLVREITNRKKSEEKLTTYVELVENAHVLIRNMEDKIVFWNKGMEELYGWGPDEAIGKKTQELFATRFLQPVNEIQDFLLKKNQWEGELFHTRKNGDVLHISSHWHLHCNKDGEPVAVLETNNDITAWKTSEEKLRKSEENIHLLIDNVKDYAIFMLDAYGLVASWNGGAEQIKKYTEAEIMGRSFDIFYTETDRLNGEPSKNLKLAEKYGHYEKEGWRVRKDGTVFWANVVFTALKDRMGNLSGFSKITRDITERKKTQEELEFLSLQINLSNDAIFTMDSKRHITNWNRGAENLYGFNKEEALGRDPNDLLKTDFSETEVDRAIEQVHMSDYWTGELKRKTKSGKYIHVRASTSSIRNDQGEIEGYVGVSYDISAQVQLRTALEASNIDLEKKVMKRSLEVYASEKNYRYLFENNPMPMYVMERDSFHIIDVNETMCLQYGYSREEFVSMTALDIRPAEDVETFRLFELKNQAHSTGAEKGIWNHRLKDGRVIQVDVFAHDIEFNGVHARLVLLNNVTEQHKAEQKLISSEKRFKALVENNYDIISMIDESFRIIYRSPSVFRVMGWKKRESQVMEGIDNVHPDDRVIAQEVMREVMANPGKQVHAVFRRQHRDGHYVWVEGVINNLLSDPDVRAIVTNFRDITERKMAEKDILKLHASLENKVAKRTQELKAKNEELESFTYSISHDLRSPLRGIIGFTTILEEEYASKLDEEGHRLTGIIKKNTLKMANLIDDLLAFSRVGKQDIVKTTIDNNRLVREIIGNLSKNEISCSVEWHIQDLPSVSADYSSFPQVWTNLISNAIKYSAKLAIPVIEIGSYITDGEIIFFIKDNGIGFDEKYKDKLFRVFQRLHSASEFEGTGVGLAIVEKIISKHGGRVWASSMPGKGASFYFTLPT